MTQNAQERKEKVFKYAYIFLAFAAICFITSIFLNSSSGSKVEQILPTTGGMVGPLHVPEDNSVYQIKVRQHLTSYGHWSFVEGEILDQNKEYLFSFGDEFWKETGYDSEGRWSEQKNSFDMKFTFKEKGTFFLNFKTEASAPQPENYLSVEVVPKKGSSLAHFILGIFSMIAFLITLAVARNI